MLIGLGEQKVASILDDLSGQTHAHSWVGNKPYPNYWLDLLLLRDTHEFGRQILETAQITFGNIVPAYLLCDF